MNQQDKPLNDCTGSADDAAAPAFGGRIGKTLQESEPWWAPRREAPPNAPNIIVVLLDDLGFSDFGCYGSEIRTPHIDALAAAGLRFINYTTVPMCTPARAALMTGKNPHAVGCGWLTHNNPGFPGYQAGEIAADTPTMAELLRAQGYSTYAVGKWHNTADYNVTPSGSRESWPLQRGFDRFYGFLAAETNYFAPGQLIDGNGFVDVDAYPEDYYCSDDWTDKAITWLKDHQSASPDKPYFLYLAHNAPHVPLQAKPADIQHYAGTYRQGWDETRKQRHARQVASGLIPSDWPLSGRSPNIPAWDELDADTQALYAHYMEVYAAMVDNIDQNIGRLVEFLRQSGSLENTIVVITSDNGASSIGGPQGAANIFEKRVSGAEPEGLASRMMHAGELGGPESYAAYPVGWGNASNTPFRFYKRTPMNGGIRVPYIVHWPRGIQDGGAVRNQWIHVTDTLPTLMEIAGIRYPDSFRGQRTRGLNGVSFRELLGDPAKPSRRTRQHYELEGNRGYIRGQWKIASLQPPGTRIDLDNWMLFDLANDPTECRDIAAAHPDLVAELIAEFEADAEANYIYPLDNRDNRRALAVPPFLEQGYARPRTFYAGASTVPTAVVSPLIADRDYVLECEFEYEAGREGVLVAFGNTFGGLTAFVERGALHLVYNGGQRQAELASIGLRNGLNRVVLTHKAMGGRQGQGTVSLNGQEQDRTLDMTPTILRLTGEGLDVGCDRRLKVSGRYRERGTFAYTGHIHWVRLSPGAQAADSLANRPERLAQLD